MLCYKRYWLVPISSIQIIDIPSSVEKASYIGTREGARGLQKRAEDSLRAFQTLESSQRFPNYRRMFLGVICHSFLPLSRRLCTVPSTLYYGWNK